MLSGLLAVVFGEVFFHEEVFDEPCAVGCEWELVVAYQLGENGSLRSFFMLGSFHVASA